MAFPKGGKMSAETRAKMSAEMRAARARKAALRAEANGQPSDPLARRIAEMQRIRTEIEEQSATVREQSARLAADLRERARELLDEAGRIEASIPAPPAGAAALIAGDVGDL